MRGKLPINLIKTAKYATDEIFIKLFSIFSYLYKTISLAMFKFSSYLIGQYVFFFFNALQLLHFHNTTGKWIIFTNIIQLTRIIFVIITYTIIIA